ncbi:thioredoxin family protein [Flavobacteriaceae bacterium]|nr:thioredoxin family protein [Flavobacteriaceae bacterium]
MKIILTFLTFALFISCNEVKKAPTQKLTEVSIPNSLKSSTLEGEEILLGKITLAQLKLFSPWYQKEYDFYKVNTSQVEELKSLLKDVQITLLLGTWCEDSQREVAPMLKILKESGFTIEDLELIAVSEDKDTPSGLEKKYDLFNVPTLIFSRENKELNRIVEFPIETLEKDMLSILKDDGYKNAYAK